MSESWLARALHERRPNTLSAPEPDPRMVQAADAIKKATEAVRQKALERYKNDDARQAAAARMAELRKGHGFFSATTSDPGESGAARGAVAAAARAATTALSDEWTGTSSALDDAPIAAVRAAVQALVLISAKVEGRQLPPDQAADELALAICQLVATCGVLHGNAALLGGINTRLLRGTIAVAAEDQRARHIGTDSTSLLVLPGAIAATDTARYRGAYAS